MNLANIRTNQITAATQVSEEAMTAAQLVIERNKDNLQALIKLNAQTNTEIKSQTGRQLLLGSKIMADFDEAMQMMSQNVTKQELFDAIEKQSARMNARFGVDEVIRVLHGTDELFGFAKEMIAARANRVASFYGSIEENQIATRIMQSVERAKAMGESYYDESLRPLSSERVREKMLQKALDSAQAPEEEAAIKMLLNQEDALEGLGEDQIRQAREARAAYGVHEMQKNVAQDVQDNLRGVGQAAAEDQAESKFKKTLRNMLAGEEYAEAADKTKYKRISTFMKEDLANLFSENKIFRNSIYGIGALIAGSLVYSAVQDRSPENVGGPPLLPGGSAYEQYPQRTPQMPRIPDQSYNPGVSYKVNLYGGRSDIEEFTRVFSGFGENMDVDTTMYSGMPEVGRDPYQEIASSY